MRRWSAVAATSHCPEMCEAFVHVRPPIARRLPFALCTLTGTPLCACHHVLIVTNRYEWATVVPSTRRLQGDFKLPDKCRLMLRARRQSARNSLSATFTIKSSHHLAVQMRSEPTGNGRVFNFAAGPATLPLEVLEQAQEDLLNYKART